MANPSKEHWKVVQWIFRYLRGTTNACLKFGKTDKGLTGYVDLDFADDLDKRRSLTGYVFTIGGCAVSWRTTLQPVVALSTTEAEYMVVAEACKESVWLKGLFAKLCGDNSYINLFFKVLYVSLKIRCSMRERSTLMSNTIMFTMWSRKVS